MDIIGEYFPVGVSRSHRCRLVTSSDNRPRLIDEDGVTLASDLHINSIQGDCNIHFSHGGYFKSDAPLSADLVKKSKNKFFQFVAWLESFSLKKAAILFVILCVSIVGLRLTLSTVVVGAAEVFPDRWEQAIGQHSYEWLKNHTVFAKSKLPKVRTDYLRTRANEMAEQAKLEKRPAIYFHQSPAFGPNALAFPGGPIVVTDELVELIKNNEQLLAIIAHEYAHIEKRHGLKNILELAGVSLLATFLFGAYDSALEEVVAVLVNLWAFKNSQGHEKEADLHGADILNAGGVNPHHLVLAMQKLSKHLCGDGDAKKIAACMAEETSGWLSTHPAGGARMKYLRAHIAKISPDSANGADAPDSTD